MTSPGGLGRRPRRPGGERIITFAAVSAAATAAAPVLVGCAPEPAPRDQWRITVATDATLPQFGNRLLVELLDDEGRIACDGCRRTFGLTGVDDLPLSFGVAANLDDVGPTTVRARLFRAAQTGPDGFPQGAAVIDGGGRLPPPSGVTPVTVNLALDCFGARFGSCAGTGELDDAAPLTSGTWPELGPVGCGDDDAPDDMVCVAGGAFLRGEAGALFDSAALRVDDERLVVLSPFLLDRDEVTVGEVRQLIREGRLEQRPLLPDPDPRSPDGTCTYLGPDDPSADAMPVNCIDHTTATAVCAAWGRRLPTEAEWEYAAGQRHRETPYPWGESPDICTRAIVGRGRVAEAYVPESSPCRTLEDGTEQTWGMVAGGSEGDVTSDGVRNLAGNVAEWTADAFAPYDDLCHDPDAIVARDPICLSPSNRYVVRGGDWKALELEVRVTRRGWSLGADTSVGLRCARDR